jgi:rubrerythrin
MSFKTVRDVLVLSQDIHSSASNLYEQLREQTQRERVDMLLKFLSKHEEELAQILAKVTADVSDKILDEWHQTELTSVAQILDGCKECHPDVSVDELVNMALRVDDSLISLYKHMASESSTDEARQLFNNLVLLEENEKMKTARAALSTNDW